MSTYIIKAIVCSAMLLLIYVLFLEKEKMHWFNRFYLLTGLALPFLIPLITIKINAEPVPISRLFNWEVRHFQIRLFLFKMHRLVQTVALFGLICSSFCIWA